MTGMNDAPQTGIASAWRWYLVPALILAAMLVADLTGALEFLRP